MLWVENPADEVRFGFGAGLETCGREVGRG